MFYYVQLFRKKVRYIPKRQRIQWKLFHLGRLEAMEIAITLPEKGGKEAWCRRKLEKLMEKGNYVFCRGGAETFLPEWVNTRQDPRFPHRWVLEDMIRLCGRGERVLIWAERWEPGLDSAVELLCDRYRYVILGGEGIDPEGNAFLRRGIAPRRCGDRVRADLAVVWQCGERLWLEGETKAIFPLGRPSCVFGGVELRPGIFRFPVWLEEGVPRGFSVEQTAARLLQLGLLGRGQVHAESVEPTE